MLPSAARRERVPSRFAFPAWPATERRRRIVDDARVLLHLFLAVLIVGTLWRLVSYHLIASPQPHMNHLGLAMATQY